MFMKTLISIISIILLLAFGISAQQSSKPISDDDLDIIELKANLTICQVTAEKAIRKLQRENETLKAQIKP